KAVLSIITTSMPLLKEFYPDYVKKYSSDLRMIADVYKIENFGTHLHPISYIKIVDLTRSIYWTRYVQQITYTFRNKKYSRYKQLIIIYLIIEVLAFVLTFPFSFTVFYILNYFNFINEFYVDGFGACFYISYWLIIKIIKWIFPDDRRTSEDRV